MWLFNLLNRLNTPFKLPSKFVANRRIAELRGTEHVGVFEKLTTPPLSTDKSGRIFIQSLWKGPLTRPRQLPQIEGYAIFATHFFLSMLLMNTLTLIDGTFKCVPVGFYQVFLLLLFLFLILFHSY